MGRIGLSSLLSGVALSLLAVPALAAGCMLHKLVELPVSVVGSRALTPAKINGVDVVFVVDTGAATSMLSLPVAERMKISMEPAPYLRIEGVGGATNTYIATADKVYFAGRDIPDVRFLVFENRLEAGAAGVLGENVMATVDAEFDLQGKVIRLIRAEGCGGAALAYWAPDKGFGSMDITGLGQDQPEIIGTVEVNGVRLRALFDTGAAASVMSTDAAARLGLLPGGPGVALVGHSQGIGSRRIQTYVAPIASFKIGGEEIKNTRLKFANLDLPRVDMLMGLDFFTSHHVYVAASQRKLYFTYVSGPVFNLDSTPVVQER